MSFARIDMAFGIMFAAFVISCCYACNAGSQTKMGTKHKVSYLPTSIRDTFLFCGSTKYSNTTDNFDTVYMDSISIYMITPDSFQYTINQIKYKELEFLDSAEVDLTKVKIVEGFVVKDSNTYSRTFFVEDVTGTTTIAFTKDSLSYFDFIDWGSRDMKENRIFKGKLLK